MEQYLGYAAVFIFVALPLIVIIVFLGICLHKAFKFQKELKAQSDALLKKLENR